MKCDFWNPTSIYFGTDALLALPKLVQKRKVLLVTSAGGQQRGWVELISKITGRLEHSITTVPAHADSRYIVPTHAAIKKLPIELVIAIGGGSVLDCGKLLAIRCGSEELLDLIQGRSPSIAHPVLPVIAIPTTCGSGSDVTPWATIWDRQKQKKFSLSLPDLFPEATLIEPTLCKSLSNEQVTISTLDALSHAFESLWNKNRNPVSAELAKTSIKTILTTLAEALNNRDDQTKLERLLVAALQAGLAFSNTRTSLAHAISYYLTLKQETPHGIACSFSLPALLRCSIAASDDLVHYLPFGMETIDRLDTLFSHLGLATSPSAYGLTSDDRLAIEASLDGNPRADNYPFDRTIAIEHIFAN